MDQSTESAKSPSPTRPSPTTPGRARAGGSVIPMETRRERGGFWKRISTRRALQAQPDPALQQALLTKLEALDERLHGLEGAVELSSERLETRFLQFWEMEEQFGKLTEKVSELETSQRDAAERTRILSRSVVLLAVSASAELLHDHALAALDAGQLERAESSIERARVRGGARLASVRAFVFGNTAYARCLKAETLARRPEAGQPEWDAALNLARSALASWKEAVAGHADWPEACRNIERAQRKLSQLESEVTKRKEAEARKKPRRRKEARIQPMRPGDEKEEVEQRPEGVTTALSEQQLAHLWRKLSRKSQAKRRLRGDAQKARSRSGGKDW